MMTVRRSVKQAVEQAWSVEDGENKLDYIFTVDIFNEGVDIPEVNQVDHAASDRIARLYLYSSWAVVFGKRTEKNMW